MNRFEHVSPSPIKYIARIIPIVFFVAMLVFFIVGISTVSETTYAKQKESLETALEHCIAQCYAIEGHYPEDISYLKDHYGLTYEQDNFIVNYTYYGGNLYPEITVLRKTGIVMR